MSIVRDDRSRGTKASRFVLGRASGLLLVLSALAWEPASSALGQAKKELPDPYDIAGNELMTADGVSLKATFFPSAKGKNAVPVICLHSWKGSRKEFATLASTLWQAGHAVLVPDLRGHGQSTMQGGREFSLATRIGPADIGLMVQNDMETLKNFLVKKNNAEELNIEKLCVVGAEMGATVAANWSVLDWSWPQYPGVKQGQHVKAVVLLSPERNFRGVGMEEFLRNPLLNQFVSIYILFGNADSKVASRTELIYSTLARLHPEPADDQGEQEKTLFFKGLDTKFQGSKLLGQRGLNVEQRIEKFIQLRLVAKDYPWREVGKKSGAGK